jgi:hypothetical protein
MNTRTVPFNEQRFSDLLTNIADALDIPESLYEEATLKYEEVGIWLAEDKDGLARYSPDIYPQGSFRLGTVVRPVNTQCEYDIDLVCHLDLAKESTTQKELKDMVGRRLKANTGFAKVLTPSRRCWNLTFPKQFHMDVLPAIANVEQPPSGILLTDTELVRWQKSNPKEYNDWFFRAMTVQFERARVALAKALNASVEDVPEWRVKTPLQRAVQLLKRHRDVLFENDENRPVSVIITTLAAHAYRNEDNVADALSHLAFNMPRYIESRNGRWWVANPVEPDENFADKWNEKPERRDAFLKWLGIVQQDVAKVLNGNTLEKAVATLESRFGETAVAEAESRLLKSLGVSLPSLSRATRPLATVPSEVRHCQYPQWPTEIRYKANLKGGLYLRKGGKRIAELANRRISKKMWLRFAVQTNTPQPYGVRWQVVNTGPEATAANQLRGDFYDSDSGGDIRWETTLFTGIHWVEAFIIKNGICVARSGRTLVSVA